MGHQTFNFRYGMWDLFIFKWRITALQSCVGFCPTLVGISHRYGREGQEGGDMWALLLTASGISSCDMWHFLSRNNRMISVGFQGKPFNITVIQVCAPTSNAEEVEVEWFYEDLQDLLELTPPKKMSFSL